jgi:rod shape-determining protein MreC
MFSKKTVLIFAGILLITVNIIFLTITIRRPTSFGFGRVMIAFAAPFQDLASRAVKGVRETWRDYFSLVSVAEENQRLRQLLGQAEEAASCCASLTWRTTACATCSLSSAPSASGDRGPNHCEGPLRVV